MASDQVYPSHICKTMRKRGPQEAGLHCAVRTDGRYKYASSSRNSIAQAVMMHGFLETKLKGRRVCATIEMAVRPPDSTGNRWPLAVLRRWVGLVLIGLARVAGSKEAWDMVRHHVLMNLWKFPS